jgi:outer membrane biosynthesis protein TonB
MRLPSGKRLGQSGYELALAVFFTFFIHAAVAAAALFLSLTAIPKKVLLPVYQVKLVGLPREPAPAPLPSSPVAPAAIPPPPEAMKKTASPLPKAGKPTARQRQATSVLNKNALPELSSQKPKPAAPPTAEAPETPPQPPTKPSAEKAAPSSGGGAETVAVTTPQQEFKAPYYLVLVRNKIGQNWRPPPDATDAKARVIFTINRSGWVVDVNLDPQHTSGTFGFQQAAIRAIRASNPFPRLPEDFSKQTLEFTVDLMAE